VGFIKKHMLILICAVGAAVGIGLSLFGMTRGADIIEGLKNGQKLANEFARFRNPDNDQAIDQMNRQLAKLRTAEKSLLEEAGRINRREPLIPGVFPEPEDDGVKYQFQDAYRKEIDGWLMELHAAGQLSRSELNDWKRMIEKEDHDIRQKGEPPRWFVDLSPDVLSLYPEEVRNNHEVRAAIWQARHAYLYAEPSSFDVRASVYQPRDSSSPATSSLWKAQIGLWLQRDIVDSILAINNTRADEIAASGRTDESPWVGNMPIKQIVGVRITDYLFADDEPAETEYAPLANLYPKRGFVISTDVGSPELDVNYVLSGHGGTDEYDVMHMRVVLVVDPRYIPVIIDKILGRNLFTILNVRYRNLPISTTFRAPLHGPDPAALLEMDLAIHWLTSIYFDLMPDETKIDLGLINDDQ